MLGTFRNWVEIVGRTLAVEGIDLTAELRADGIDLAAAVPHDGRIEPPVSRAIWRVVERRSGDPVFGLSMLRTVDYLDFEELGVALVAGGSVQRILERVVRYHGLVSDRVALSLDVGERMLELTVDHHAGHWRAGEFSAGLMTSMLRTRFARELGPAEVHLGFANPPGAGIYRRFFRAQVVMGAPVTRLTFDRAVIARYSIHEPIGVAERFEDILRRREEALSGNDSTGRLVRERLRALLGVDPPTLERVAAGLHVSERTLQRRLNEEGTSFAALLDQARRESATAWLEAGKLSRTEIAYLLGFSQPSSFSRAMRRWFPPGA
jgi:AraC-like DNA-binding protein